jgi:hypothetical protein
MSPTTGLTSLRLHLLMRVRLWQTGGRSDSLTLLQLAATDIVNLGP